MCIRDRYQRRVRGHSRKLMEGALAAGAGEIAECARIHSEQEVEGVEFETPELQDGPWLCWQCRVPAEVIDEHWCECAHVFCKTCIDQDTHECEGRHPVDARSFFKGSEFAALAALSERWEEILAEVEQLHGEGFIFWPERNLYNERGNAEGWTVYGLYSFGQKLEEQCARCPVTTALVEAIPGMKMAGFSSLKANTHIAAHKGYAEYSSCILRAHLGIVVPPKCRLRVSGQVDNWREGEWTIFDDTQLHQAWNEHPNRTRIVLLVDFEAPEGYQTLSEGLDGFNESVQTILDRPPNMD
eukprot:TRINITY_DN32707_c0_g1_i1.p1 TRINITY_DN32707_c0_g1~~TRINITY_DN32707_c0_g1_i1.p1  ORF type:complete len:299 (-),score=58.76 TRINITY_DN32707_c0_g1_i1:120-1016(-)